MRIIRYIIAITIFYPVSLLAYEYPVGIPEGWIAPDIQTPSAPTPWTTQITNKYYVDNSVSCTDSMNTYGYPTNPRCTIPVNLAAGSYVSLNGGPYNWTTAIRFNASGTAIDPVWVVGDSSRPEIDISITISGTYFIIENIALINDKTVSIRPYNNIQTDHILLRGWTIHGTGTPYNTQGIGVSGASGYITGNIIIYNNVLDNLGDSEGLTENDYHGIKPEAYSQNVWILNNVGFDLGGDTIQIGNSTLTTTERPNFVYVGNNIGYGNLEDGVDIKRANNIIISGNEFYNMKMSGISAHGGPDNIWLINNYIHDTVANGIVAEDVDKTYVVGNLITDIKHDPVAEPSWAPSASGNGVGIKSTGNDLSYIINNTIIDCDIGIAMPSGDNLTISGNIVSGRTQSNGYELMIPSSTQTATSSIDYGIMYHPDNVNINWSGFTYTSVTTFLDSTNECQNCKEAPVLFVSASNFGLQAASPAKDTGVLSDVYETFQTLYGLSMARDRLGVTRPQNSTWDMGAYEYRPVHYLYKWPGGAFMKNWPDN